VRQKEQGMSEWVRRRLTAAWHHLVGYFIHYLAILTIGSTVAYFKYIRDSKSEPLQFYFKQLIEYVTPLTIAFLAVVSFILFLLSLKQRGQIRHLESEVSVLKGFGIRAFSTHDTTESRKKDWELISSDVARASKSESPLWIMGATGKHTFADHTSPLHACILEYAGPIKLLLIRPESDGFRHRVEKVPVNPEAFRDEILESLEFCKNLHKAGKNIEVKLYDGPPIWKMIAIPDSLWLQHYAAGRQVDETPAYGFLWVDKRPTIVDGLRAAFIKRWTHDGSFPVNLAQFSRDSWRACCGLPCATR
jgi:hypothetical protein